MFQRSRFAARVAPPLVCLLIFTAGVVAATLPPVPESVETITSAELRMHVEFLASDELGGRYTLSPSFAIAARYLASHLKGYGFTGGGKDGSFLQTFEVLSTKADPAKTQLELTIDGKSESSKLGEDFLTGVDSATGEAAGQIVFLGAGISTPEQGHDDYKGVDVKGKIVLLVSANPVGLDIEHIGRDQEGSSAAAGHGAAGVLVVPAQRFLENMRKKTVMQSIAGRERVALAPSQERRIPMLMLGPELSEKLLRAAGMDLNQAFESAKRKEAVKPVLIKASARMAVALLETRTTTQNVVGILPGSDPRLKEEYVVFSAHYDHLKTGSNGEIYHGADDDGSGTSAVLAIAHAMSKERPKRSVMVVFHAGEEMGLLGSSYNTDVHPAVPLQKIVADFNIDMIGRSKPQGDTAAADEHLTDSNTVYLVGSDRISPELHGISEETNQQFQKMKLDYYYNDPANPERIYYRSDHWNYARHGIPVIFYFDGTHVDYHRPTDTVDKIDFEKMMKVTRLVFETGWRVAELDHRLSVSKTN
jgi:peptidase M28-like protein